jgi:hypothetical protein
MLEWFLFGLGIFFVILGVTKKTGFEGKDWNTHVSTGFFIYGFFLITAAVFLFNAVTPYGYQTTKNVSYSYYPENLTVYSYDDTGLYQGMENRTVEIVNTTSESYAYNTGAGPDIANTIFYVNAVLGTIWAILWALMMLKDAFSKKKQMKQDNND